MKLNSPRTGEIEGTADAGLALVGALEVALELGGALRRVRRAHHVQQGLGRGHVEHRGKEVARTAEEGGRGASAARLRLLLRLLGLLGAEGRDSARGQLGRRLGPDQRRHQADERRRRRLEARREPRVQARRVAVPRGAEVAVFQTFALLIVYCTEFC